MQWQKVLENIPDNRPVFMKMVDENEFEQPNLNGYTLQVNIVDRCASIINLTKGGRSSMIKTVVKALEGFERQFDDLNEMKANLELEKEEAKKVAIAEVEAKFAVKSERIDKVLETVSVTEEIEVPDEEVVTTEVVYDGEVVEEVAPQVESNTLY